MKKFIFFTLFFGFFNLNSNDLENTKPSVSEIWDETLQVPHSALKNLLNLFNIDSETKNLKSIVKSTQDKWLRTPGKERWEIEEIKVEDKNKVLEALSQLGCVDEVKPAQKNYDTVLVLGAAAQRMKLRTATVVNMWKKGIKFKKLVFLNGQRPRDKQFENETTFILDKNDKNLKVKKNWKFNGVTPETETEIMKLIFQQISLPRDFKKNVEVEFVDTPMQSNKDGSLRRPNTGDTVKEFLKTNSNPGKCLFISNNPYVGYQRSVIKTFMPKDANFEVIGDSASSNEKVVTYLDTLARWLYQEDQRLNQILN